MHNTRAVSCMQLLHGLNGVWCSFQEWDVGTLGNTIMQWVCHSGPQGRPLRGFCYQPHSSCSFGQPNVIPLNLRAILFHNYTIKQRGVAVSSLKTSSLHSCKMKSGSGLGTRITIWIFPLKTSLVPRPFLYGREGSGNQTNSLEQRFCCSLTQCLSNWQQRTVAKWWVTPLVSQARLPCRRNASSHIHLLGFVK